MFRALMVGRRFLIQAICIPLILILLEKSGYFVNFLICLAVLFLLSVVGMSLPMWILRCTLF